MSLTGRELWALVHGMFLGSLFLLAFAGGLAGLYSLRPGLLTTAGSRSGCDASRSERGRWP
jgi:hypothetical protein